MVEKDDKNQRGKKREQETKYDDDDDKILVSVQCVMSAFNILLLRLHLRPRKRERKHMTIDEPWRRWKWTRTSTESTPTSS